jgi:hypothetical protein
MVGIFETRFFKITVSYITTDAILDTTKEFVKISTLAEVAEQADAHDSNSCSFGSVGSIPTFGTPEMVAGLAKVVNRRGPSPLDGRVLLC